MNWTRAKLVFSLVAAAVLIKVVTGWIFHSMFYGGGGGDDGGGYSALRDPHVKNRKCDSCRIVAMR